MKVIKTMKIWLTFCLLCLSSAQLFGLTVTSGTTLTIGSMNMADNIIVENNALLIINGNLTFGNPLTTDEYYIHVKNGGRVYSSSGSCTGLVASGVQRIWKGFIVEPTISSIPSTTLALDLDNFTISNARKAIELAGTIPGWIGRAYFISRELSVKNTQFVNNKSHIMSGSAGYEFGANRFTTDNRDYGINSTKFINCDFQYATDAWSVWLIYHRNVLFDGCTFNMGTNADMAIHYNSIRDCDMVNNTFLETNILGIVFHGENFDITMNYNTFSPPSTTNNDYAGIAVGFKINGGGLYGGAIMGNVFQGPGTSPSRNGIIIGSISTLGYTPGFASGVAISNNMFIDMNIGVGLFNQEAGSPYMAVLKNTFSGCNTGLQVDKNASNTNVYCNTFNNSSSGFKITDDIGTSSVKNWSGQDQNNQFNSVAICINNLSTNTFLFWQSPSNPAPPYSFSGPVLGSSTLLIRDCNGKRMESFNSETDVENETRFNVYPNPSNGIFTIEFEESKQRLIEIFDASGRTVYENDSDYSKVNIDLSDRLPGVYILRVKEGNTVSQERIILE